MAKQVILIGGGDFRKKENKQIDKYLTSILKSSSRIVIIPFAAERKKYASWFSALYNNYKEKRFWNFELLTPEMPSKYLRERIESADAVFLTGGLPLRLLAILKQKKLVNALIKYKGFLIGYSAGTIVLSKYCVSLPERGNMRAEVFQGLGIVPFSTYVHYNRNQDDYLSKFSQKRTIIAIHEKSALIYKDKHIRLIGRAEIFEKGKKISGTERLLSSNI